MTANDESSESYICEKEIEMGGGGAGSVIHMVFLEHGATINHIITLQHSKL